MDLNPDQLIWNKVLTPVCFSSTKEKNTKDEIVVEMKSDARAEGSVLLKAANGDQKDPGQPMTVVSVRVLIHKHSAAVRKAQMNICNTHFYVPAAGFFNE